jgi:hypothetical protein
METWLTVLKGHIGHLHLHDNDGNADQHLGLGQGTIPWDELWAFVRHRAAPVSATFEPHTEDDFLITQAYLLAHQEILPKSVTPFSRTRQERVENPVARLGT